MQHEMQHVFNQAPNLWVLYAHLSGFESRRLRSEKKCRKASILDVSRHFPYLLFHHQPFSLPCIQYHEHRAKRPRNRIQHKNTIDRGKQRKHKLDPDDPKQAEGCQKDHHRRHTFSCSANRSRQSVHNTEQEIERAEIAHCLFSERDHRRVFREHPHERIRKSKQQHSRQYRVYKTHRKRDPHALLHAVDLSCAVILPGKCCHCHAEAHDRQDVESVNLHICPESRHRRSTKAIDTGLHEHIGKRDDHILDPGRQSDCDDPGRHLFLYPDLSEADLIIRRHAHQKKQGQHAGNKLADVRCDCRSRDTHMKPCDQHQIQYDIRNGRDRQIEQGTPGISCRI